MSTWQYVLIYVGIGLVWTVVSVRVGITLGRGIRLRDSSADFYAGSNDVGQSISEDKP